METVMAWFMYPGARAPKAAFWIRLMAGWVFFWEGVIKFVFVNQGVGRFNKLGMPLPEVLAPAIAVLEIVGGLCFILGVWTGTGSVSCNSVFVRYLGRFLNQEELMEHEATVQNP
jgi:putative oxidoreductase